VITENFWGVFPPFLQRGVPPTWLKENGGFPARWIPYSDLGLGIDGGLVLLRPETIIKFSHIKYNLHT
jgi:hypothetical protein